DRDQISIFPVSIDASIEKDNFVRVIDFFVNSLDIGSMGFRTDYGENGRPAYHPKDLLKLFIYGYLNRIRSSRTLEKECKRNIELMWLMKCLVPDHNTISNFRRDNPKAIKKVFKATVNIAKNFNLIGGILIAGDGTKLRAQNSKKNNYNQKKIDRHIAYIENKLSEYCKALEEADDDKKKEIRDKIDKHKEQKKKYQEIEKQLKETGEKQVSTSDPESRHLIIRGMITEVSYNVQSTVDGKNKIPINYDVTNVNDSNAMTDMVEQAIEIVENNTFDAVFDKGYHKAEQLDNCHKLGVETHVAIPKPASNAPDKSFNVSEFIYNKQTDTYTCPAGQTLRTNGNWYKKKSYRVKQYKTSYCNGCELKKRCTRSKSKRLIERHEFAEALERNKKALKEHPEIYKQRQSIVEHPFGTIKRQWGFNYIMTKKTKERANADVGLIFIAYNLKRIFNLIGFEKFTDFLKAIIKSLISTFFAIKTPYLAKYRSINVFFTIISNYKI
ncbi:MAG: IS1182 family transposase, partial [Bacteroidetes bacterium]